MIELPTEFMLHTTQGYDLSSPLLCKVIYQLSHLRVCQLGIENTIPYFFVSVNTTPGVVVEEQHYSQLSFQDMGQHSSAP